MKGPVYLTKVNRIENHFTSDRKLKFVQVRTGLDIGREKTLFEKQRKLGSEYFSYMLLLLTTLTD